ncbi:major facilitator superfamily domain-containing protein [Peziza echinospora]|nr:major facilitator superfamily domain-containing protein [Peziza echinospora]
MSKEHEVTQTTARGVNSDTDSSTASFQIDLGSSEKHVFTDDKISAYWQDIYEKVQYEGRHRFDRLFTWTAEEEKKLVRKIDLRIMLWAWIMFISLDLNRSNVNRAITDNMLPELGMNTNDFNYGQTIFLVSFLAAELPSGLISKKVGPDRWIPFLIVAWSTVSASQAALTTKTGFFVTRALLGITMGGFIPDIVLYLTYFYKSSELPMRLAWFWTALSTCQIVGALLAAGILQLRGRGGYSGWQYLYIIEGSITSAIGLASWLLMPAGPCQTASWWSKSWFSEREEKILVNRLLRDDPSKGDMNNRQAVNHIGLLKSLGDFDLWPTYLLGLIVYIPPKPVSTYLAYILRQLGFSVFHANLMTIPSQVLFMINLLILTKVSQYFKEKSIVSAISNIWMFPFFLSLVLTTPSKWARYILLSGILSYPYCHAILVAWNSENSNTVRTRAVSAAIYNMFVQSGSIIASNIYRDDDKPLYKRGNKILLIIVAVNIVAFLITKGYYIWRNNTRAKIWDAYTAEEKEHYVTNTTDEGSKRLDFQFAH